MKKSDLAFALLIASGSSTAGNYSSWAVPTQVELVNNGVLVHGAFGDPNSCGEPNYIYISEDDSKYESVLSMALAAFMAKKEMRFYANDCKHVSFHWANESINWNRGAASVYIK